VPTFHTDAYFHVPFVSKDTNIRCGTIDIQWLFLADICKFTLVLTNLMTLQVIHMLSTVVGVFVFH